MLHLLWQVPLIAVGLYWIIVMLYGLYRGYDLEWYKWANRDEDKAKILYEMDQEVQAKLKELNQLNKRS